MDPDRLKKHWIGKRVISVSNAYVSEPDNPSLNVGVVTDLVPLTRSMTLVPMIKFDGIDEPMLVMSVVMPHSDVLLESLNKLNAKERWTIIQSFVLRFICN